MSQTLLIVGARENGLGARIRETALARHAREDWKVVTAGVAGEERLLDVCGPMGDMVEVLQGVQPSLVVCTVGKNEARDGQSLGAWMSDHFFVNVTGPMRLLDAWLMAGGHGEGSQYVAISSNSAHIARRGSTAYCASKAALSMALRVRAREIGGDPVVVYGYEPGLLANTPMTEEVRQRFEGPLSRMQGSGLDKGLNPYRLAGMVVCNLALGGAELNGCMLRIDAGEQ